MKEKLIGKVTHYFTNIGVGVIKITKDAIKTGESIHLKGTTTDFEQEIGSMQIEHENVKQAKAGQTIGLKVDQLVRENDEVYKIVE